MNTPAHIPVLVSEVIEQLHLASGDHAVDATLGGGGHAAAILAATAPDGMLIGIDWDASAVARARERLTPYEKRIILVKNTYRNIKDVVYESRINTISAILLDLGLSRDQLEDQSRGFGFQTQGQLDMRFSDEEGVTASDIVNSWSEDELTNIFRIYGEERHAARVAHHIIATRKLAPIRTVPELVDQVMRGAGRRGGHRVHPATRIFQALRIAVNKEFENITAALPDMIDLLKPGGRIAVLTYHSLEDRIVKQFFRDAATDCICPPEVPICSCDHRAKIRLINKRVIVPTEAEQKQNPSSRSAKLRVVEKLP